MFNRPSWLQKKSNEETKNGGPPKPRVLTLREVIEDIGNMKKNDPILTLAAILEKSNGRHSMIDSDIRELGEAIKRRKRRESLKSTPASHTYSNLKNIQSAESKGQDDDVDDGDESKDATEELDPSERIKLSYDKLKHFLTTCEKSQAVIGTLEGDLKRLQIEVAQHYLRQEDERRQQQEEQKQRKLEVDDSYLL